MRSWQIAGLASLVVATAPTQERRNEVSFLRGKYNTDFFARHGREYRYSAAIHVAHGLAHDWQHNREGSDEEFDRLMQRQVEHPPRVETHQSLYAPTTARFAWQVLRSIDWTHTHHDQTYDIMASRSVGWSEKKDYTDRSVSYYLSKELPGIPRSVAPLDVTMRRAAVMMKPYFSLYRNEYPRSSTFFFVAHWWHPVIYEAQMIGGNGEGQDRAVEQTHDLLSKVLADRPQRMLLTRELMPRYSRMSPQSGNIFDNLHMLHGIVYDLLTYQGWNEKQKREELYRVIRAMGQQPGDEALARKFPLPRPDMDPRVYADWMKPATEGEMPRIMREMMMEMMPMMMPDATEEEKKAVMEQFRMKMTPGMQAGEHPGSLHDALMKVFPRMKMMPGSMEPGKTPEMMVEAMMKGWREKHGAMPDVPPIDMGHEPVLQGVPR